MFCPKCATQNMDNAKFCRACGADISLVPAALTGRMPQGAVASVDESSEHKPRRRNKKKKEATYEKALENMGVGLAFMIISIAVAFYVPSGRFWWFWLLIPAFACMGEGLGQLIRIRREQLPSVASLDSMAELPPTHAIPELPSRSTSEIMAPPPSVTEGTTRHLGAEAPNKR